MRTLAACALVFAVMASCGWTSLLSRPTPASVDNIPIYTNPQQLKTLADNIWQPTTTTTYQVDATVDQVKQFYQDTLLKDGWTAGNNTPTSITYLIYSWDSCPYIHLSVILTAQGGNLTDVKLINKTEGCS